MYSSIVRLEGGRCPALLLSGKPPVMNPRHAALVLAFWLMAPPVAYWNKTRVDTYAELRNWQLVGQFKSVAACEKAAEQTRQRAKREIADLESASSLDANPDPGALARVEGLSMAKCVSEQYPHALRVLPDRIPSKTTPNALQSRQ